MKKTKKSRPQIKVEGKPQLNEPGTKAYRENYEMYLGLGHRPEIAKILAAMK